MDIPPFHFSCLIRKAQECWVPLYGVSCMEKPQPRRSSYPNFARHQPVRNLLKCWVGHKVGSGWAAEPRKVGESGPSISSAAQEREKTGMQSAKKKQRETRVHCPPLCFLPRGELSSVVVSTGINFMADWVVLKVFLSQPKLKCPNWWHCHGSEVARLFAWLHLMGKEAPRTCL